MTCQPQHCDFAEPYILDQDRSFPVSAAGPAPSASCYKTLWRSRSTATEPCSEAAPPYSPPRSWSRPAVLERLGIWRDIVLPSGCRDVSPPPVWSSAVFWTHGVVLGASRAFLEWFFGMDCYCRCSFTLRGLRWHNFHFFVPTLERLPSLLKS